jgi:hypothetical protein
MVAAGMVAQLPLMGAGLQVTVADMAGQRLRSVAEGPQRMAEAEQHRLTEVVGATVADLAVGTRLPAVVAVATAAAVEVGTVAAGTTELRSHRIFQERRLRAALLFRANSDISCSADSRGRCLDVIRHMASNEPRLPKALGLAYRAFEQWVSVAGRVAAEIRLDLFLQVPRS